MGIKSKFSLPIFLILFFLLTLSSHLAVSAEEREETEETDPELETCKHQCQQQRQYSEEDKRICMRKCDEYYDTKHAHEHEHEQEKEEDTHHEHHDHGEKEEDTHHEHHGEKEKENPYVFVGHKHVHTVQTAEAKISVLHKFTHLLRGIQNFRFSSIEIEPHVFMTPRHYDSEIVLVNVKGHAIIGLVKEDETEKYSLESGNMLRIPAGTPVYIVNSDSKTTLSMIMLHIPISTPGDFEEFTGFGKRNPESILEAFSREVLQSAYNTPVRKLEKLFDQQNEGSIFTISAKDVKALSPKKSSWWLWPSGDQLINLFKKDPLFFNRYGSLTQVTSSDKYSGLEGLNLMLTYTIVTKGCMSTILYNSHATKIAVVVDGEGKFEMACPHLSSESYHKVTAELKPGTVFVVPPGHPFVTIASKSHFDLKIISFEVHAEFNKRLTYAGKNNIVSVLDKPAKELAFNYPAEKVDKIFNRKEQFFFPFMEDTEDHESRFPHLKHLFCWEVFLMSLVGS
ncbi:hypothetical protein VNO77_16449 [Canavalia gladiata]|uniref:Cupin type-1 domain-containing protein n=1 Tax=Canavalia gladiata TaxID=3824 RepID=A0AAN9M133_CANGL